MKFSILIVIALLMVSLPMLYAQEKESLRFVNRMEPIVREYYRIGNYEKALEGYLALD
jgi:hypothetical protein